MNTSSAIRCVATAALFGLSAVSAGELEQLTSKLPQIDGPPRGETQWIARSMRLNGVPMTIKSFQTSLSVDDVIHHYERSSRGKSSQQISRNRNGEWHVLGLHTHQHHVSIQVRSTSEGSEGTIAVTGEIKRDHQRPDTEFPRPSGVELASLQEYDDLGIEAEHIDFTS